MAGFGGSVAAANHAMKANRAMLKKRKKRKLSFASSTDEKWVDPKQPTFEQLMEIRTRIRKEEKARRKKVIVTTVLALIIVIVGIIYIVGYIPLEA
ncbi:hypothetical protein [Dokdonia sp.]|uniref:hypothetical protein n=1 Tax=Dokdonia sp. TaxID=2024995 RepID=UPI003266032D